MSLILSGTDGLSDVDGSAATPAIRGTDANTGIFFPAADTIAFAEGGAEVMRIDSSGNVGIGASSVISKLQVVADQASYVNDLAQLTITGTNTNQRLLLGYNTSTDKAFIQATKVGTAYQDLVLQSGGGNLLVGTTTSGGWSTTAKFEAYTTTGWGVSAYNNANGSGAFLGRVNNTAAVLAAWYYSTTNVGSITTNGTTTTYGSISDYRLKEHVVPMTNALSILSQLNPVTYNWKSNGSGGQGFIAHELQAVVPDCVAGKKDEVNADGSPKYQSVDTSFLVATLTAAIQEQQALITALTARITALETPVPTTPTET
jgi:hypothetical protein